MSVLLLPLTHTAIFDCRSHIDQRPDVDPVVTAYLTRYINGLMCAEIESVVARFILQRIEVECSDIAASNFLTAVRRDLVRNARFTEIRKQISLLGEDYEKKLVALVDQTVGEDGKQKLGNAVANRNANAHERPIDITFSELQEAFDVATKIVDAVRIVLTTN